MARPSGSSLTQESGQEHMFTHGAGAGDILNENPESGQNVILMANW